MRWPFRRYPKILIPQDDDQARELPPLPKHVAEMLNEAISDYLQDPGPATAWALGVECQFVGHFDPAVNIAPHTVLHLWLRDAAHGLSEDDERTMNDLMADL